MKAIYYSNNSSESQQEISDVQTKSMDLDQSFDNHEVLQFWDQLSDEEREEILLLHEKNIIENVSHALNDFNFIACLNGQLEAKAPINRTVVCRRKEKPGIIVSILELDRLCVGDADSKENNYFMSVVILLFKGFEDINNDSQTKEANQIINEEDLREYICNVELLEKYGALLKIKASKLETIMLDFVSINHEFCHGKKKIVPTNQYWSHFVRTNNQAVANDSQKPEPKNLTNPRLKSRVQMASILQLFENNILQAYLENLKENQPRNDENQNVPNQWNQQYQQAHNAWPQQQIPTVQQVPNIQQFHFQQPQHHQFIGNAYPFPEKHYEYGYYNYYGNPYGHIAPQHGFPGGFGEMTNSTLIPVAHGVYFGRLDFILRDHDEEEQEFGTHEQSNPRGPRTKTDYFKQSNEFFDRGFNRAKRHNTFTNGTYVAGNDFNPPNRNFVPNYHQPGQLIDPLQMLLGKSHPYTQTIQPQKQEVQPSGQPVVSNKPTTTIPLLETIIKIPTMNNQSTQIHPNPTAFPPNQGFGISQPKFSKPFEEFPYRQNFFMNIPENEGQDEFEVSTANSMGSISRFSDRDSLGEPFTRHSKNTTGSKNSYKFTQNAKFQGGGNYRKDWDHRSHSNQNSDTQSRKLSDIPQNFDNTTEFQSLTATPNDPTKISSKDKF